MVIYWLILVLTFFYNFVGVFSNKKGRPIFSVSPAPNILGRPCLNSKELCLVLNIIILYYYSFALSIKLNLNFKNVWHNRLFNNKSRFNKVKKSWFFVNFIQISLRKMTTNVPIIRSTSNMNWITYIQKEFSLNESY